MTIRVGDKVQIDDDEGLEMVGDAGPTIVMTEIVCASHFLNQS